MSIDSKKTGEILFIFTFIPFPDAKFNDMDRFVSKLKGEMWVDVNDRIVTRLTGWPIAGKEQDKVDPAATAEEKPPAVYIEMMRLPQDVWLPHIVRINGADYPTLFDRVTNESTITYSEYKRFITDVKEGHDKQDKQDQHEH